MIDEGVFNVERLTLLYDLSQAFSTLMTLDELLPSIIAKTKEVLAAESCALLLVDEERQKFYFPVISDLNPAIKARFKNIRFPMDKGVAGWVLQHGKPARVPDATRDARFYTDVDRHSGGADPRIVVRSVADTSRGHRRHRVAQQADGVVHR